MVCLLPLREENRLTLPFLPFLRRGRGRSLCVPQGQGICWSLEYLEYTV